MKMMIGYATKSGAARECAELLKQKLAECDMIDMERNSVNPAEYDIVIIGSGVRMGKLYKPVRKFLKDNHAILLQKKVACYLCNAYPENLQKAVDKNFPKELAASAVCIESFGGYPPYAAKGVDKSAGIKTEQIALFAQKIKEELKLVN